MNNDQYTQQLKNVSPLKLKDEVYETPVPYDRRTCTTAV